MKNVNIFFEGKLVLFDDNCVEQDCKKILFNLVIYVKENKPPYMEVKDQCAMMIDQFFNKFGFFDELSMYYPPDDDRAYIMGVSKSLEFWINNNVAIEMTVIY